MKKVIQVSAMVIVAIGVGVTVVLAAGGTHEFWGTVQANSGSDTSIVIEVVSPGDLDDEVVAYVSPSLGGYVTDWPEDPRAEILITRTSTDGTGEAWMKSSAGAKVKVQTNGDVVIDLGS